MSIEGRFSYGAITEKGKKPIVGMQTLWDGSWSSGEIDVPNVRSYTMFLIYTSNIEIIPAFYNNVDGTEYLSGIGGRAISSSSEVQCSFECTMEGNTLTMVHCHSHKGSSSRTAQTVSKIVGVF